MSSVRYSYWILIKLIFFYTHCAEIFNKYFRKILSMWTDRRTQTDVTQLVIAFCNFAKAPNENQSAKNLCTELKYHRLYALCAVFHISLKCHSLYILRRLFFKAYVTIKLREFLVNLQAPCVMYIRKGVSLLSRERFLHIFNQQIYFINCYLLHRASLI